MSPEQLAELKLTVAESIEKNVNGKIRRLDEKIDMYIREDNEYKERMTRETGEWRKGADDKLAVVASVQGFGKVAGYLLAIIITLGGATAVVVSFINWLKN
jgi:glutamate dehydrogenase/leucine dehydrogenase